MISIRVPGVIRIRFTRLSSKPSAALWVLRCPRLLCLTKTASDSNGIGVSKVCNTCLQVESLAAFDVLFAAEVAPCY